MSSVDRAAFDITTEFDDAPLQEQTMDSILRNRADALGSRTFVTYGPEDRPISFEELNHVANAIGTGLLGLGVEPREPVSVLLRHPLETLFVMCGIHKAGAIYSPINFEYKGSALAYQLNDTDPDVLVVEDQYVGRLNAIASDLEDRPHLVVLATDSEAEAVDDRYEYILLDDLKRESSREPDVDVAWNHEASIVYTSGTTGMPKGVVLPHRWIFGNYTVFSSQTLRPGDVVHTSLPLYHVGGVYSDVTAALVAGASVALWDRFSPNEFWNRVDQYGVTKTTLLSVMISWLVKQPSSPDDDENTLKRVHMQPLPENYDELAERFGFEFVSVGFGQTESGNPIRALIHANPGSTPPDCNGIRPADFETTAQRLGVPIVEDIDEDRYMGRPAPFVDVAVVDERDEPLPPGEVGELVVRPKQTGILLNEYYDKPERTLEAVRNLWFHTGDAAYRDEEGNFYFVDRIGDVIRRRGENISSMQIQDVLVAHEDVSKAAVFPIPAEEGGEDQIGAALEPARNDVNIEGTVGAYLDGELPSFMHPDELLVVDELPTTETNKIEKYKLKSRLQD